MSRLIDNVPLGSTVRLAIAVGGVLALSACDGDRAGVLDPRGRGSGQASVVTFPSIVGDYRGTAVAKLTASVGSKTYTCSATISIPTQADSNFSGTFTVQPAADCDPQSGTLSGTVALNDSVTFTADTPGGGADVWEDGAARTGCRLVSSTPFTGTASAGTLSAAGRGVYDCPIGFGTVRVHADVQVTVTKA
jgi:hypothetical protein